MTLLVPLTVRIGNQHITREVSAVRFRKEAVGGVRNIQVRLARPLDRFDMNLAAYSRVYLYDARSGVTLAEGRLSDFGRSAGSDGQLWDIVAFGPVQHASDTAQPLIYVDQRQDTFVRRQSSTRNATTDSTGGIDGDTPSLEVRAEEGKTVATTWVGDFAMRALVDTGQFVARVRCTMDSGVSDANYRQQILVNSTVAKDIASSTTATGQAAVITTDFATGLNEVIFRAKRQTSGTTGAETHWFEFSAVYVRTVLKTKAGADITAAASYSVNTVLASEIVADLLGRVLTQYDGANANIATTSTGIEQLAYPDGATAEQILDDLMVFEPAYRWTTGPSDPTSGLYSFSWEAWPTTVRYEATLDDGASLPASAQELFNEVTVRWKNPNGQTRTTPRTKACAILDAAGIARSTIIDAGDEVGSLAQANTYGDNFLAEHNVPNNAGTLTISRPIRDLTTGALVQPFEIEPGELIRVRGVESYPDALNASSNDGLTVFRIWSMEYDSDSNSAMLELDTYSRTTANALARLMKRRNRRR